MDPPERSKALAERLGVTFPILADVDLKVTRAYGVEDGENGIAWPAIFIVGTDGGIRWRSLAETYPERPASEVVLDALAPPRSSTGRADAGLVEVVSAHDVKETVARLEGALTRANVTVVAKIDHAAAAAKVGEQLPPTVLLVFGNPKLGTPLMRCAPSAGIDLPLKALVRDDGAGRVTLTYSDPGWIAARHGAKGCDEVVKKMSGALRSFAEVATAR